MKGKEKPKIDFKKIKKLVNNKKTIVVKNGVVLLKKNNPEVSYWLEND